MHTFYGWVVWSPHKGVRLLFVGSQESDTFEIAALGCSIAAELGTVQASGGEAARDLFKPMAGPVQSGHWMYSEDVMQTIPF